MAVTARLACRCRTTVTVLVILAAIMCPPLSSAARARKSASGSSPAPSSPPGDEAVDPAEVSAMLQRAHALGPRHEGYLPLLRQAAGASKTHWAAHEVLLRALVDGIIAGRSVDLNKTVYDLDDPAELKEATKHAKVLRKLYKSDKQRYHNLAVEQLPFYFLDAGNRIEGADRPLCALKVYRIGLVIAPKHPHLEISVYKVTEFLCDWRGRDAARAHVIDVVNQQLRQRSGRTSLQPLTALSQDVGGILQRDVASTWADFYAGMRGQSAVLRSTAALDALVGQGGAQRALRVGFLSSDMRRHAVTWLVQSMFAAHKRRGAIETYIYSNNARPADAWTRDIAASATKFIDVARLDDATVASTINNDAVAVVVDMNGHTGGNRLTALSLRPAPVSMGYLGYAGTVGGISHGSLLDYIIADRIAAPPELRQAFTESLALMPPSYYPANPKLVANAPPTRESVGLPAGAHPVLVCFNRNLKIKPGTLALWARVLDAVPQAALWPRRFHFRAQENIIAAMRNISAGAAERLVFAGGLGDKSAHLARHLLADMFLDTPGFNGHSTVADALLAGVPVLTLAGDTLAARISTSMTLYATEDGALGRTFAARTDDEYVRVAVAAAKRGPAWWSGQKAQLIAARERGRGAFDVEAYAARIEGMYRLAVELAAADPSSRAGVRMHAIRSLR